MILDQCIIIVVKKKEYRKGKEMILMDIKKDLKELVTLNKNTQDIHMVKGNQRVDDIYTGLPWLAMFNWLYAIFTKRYKAEHMAGTVFKYVVYFWIASLLIGLLFGYDSVIGYVLSEALTIYQTVWFICSWRHIYIQVLERNGFHKVDANNAINELAK